MLTEGLAHDLLGTAVTAHLLIPGFTFTGFTRARIDTQPPGAWTPEQVVAFMLDALARGDTYILCPDNDTTREMDEKRMRWAMEDIIQNRPALSRWHPDYAEAFKAYMARMSVSGAPARCGCFGRSSRATAGPALGATVALLASAGLVLALGQGLRHLIDGGFASGSPARLNATALAMAGVIVLLALPPRPASPWSPGWASGSAPTCAGRCSTT